MTGEDKMGRRLSDPSSSSDFVTLLLEIQKQSLMLENLTGKVSGITDLTRKVDMLVANMETISDEVDSIQAMKELVSWHERLWKLIAAVCVLLFPSILGSVFWMWVQISALQSEQSLLKFKLQYMEESNGQTPANPNTSSTDNEYSWYFRDSIHPRIQEISFNRVAMEEQSSKCQLYTSGKVSLHF